MRIRWPLNITIEVSDWKKWACAVFGIAEGKHPGSKGPFNPVVFTFMWRSLGFFLIWSNHRGDKWRAKHPEARAWEAPKPPEPGARERELLSDIALADEQYARMQKEAREAREQMHAANDDARDLARLLGRTVLEKLVPVPGDVIQSIRAPGTLEWEAERDAALARHFARTEAGL